MSQLGFFRSLLSLRAGLGPEGPHPAASSGISLHGCTVQGPATQAKSIDTPFP